MKKNTSKILIIIFFVLSRPDVVLAQYVVETPTLTTTTIADNIKAYILDKMNNWELTLTEINTYKTMWDKTVGDKLRDLMTLMSIQKSASQILNLVNGSSNGNSLLVANPEKYVKGIGTNSYQASYNAVAARGGIYSDSVLATLRDTARSKNESDPNNTIVALTQSDIPSTIQRNVCADAALSTLAKEAVSDGITVMDQVAYANKKQQLYNALCVGNPRTDKKLAQLLLDINKQVPSLGGWDVWLQSTGGDNAYTASVYSALQADKIAQLKQEAAKQDLANGKGIKSPATCTKYGEAGPNGSPAPCIETAISNSSAAIADAYSKAKTAAFDTAKSTFGTGGDGSSFFGDLSSILSFAKDAYNTVSDVTNTINGISNSIDSTINAVDKAGNILDNNLSGQGSINVGGSQPRTANTPTISNQSYVQDLLGNPTKKTNALKSAQNILNSHITAINNLQEVDNNYVAKINYYLGLVTGIKNCYSNIENYARVNNYTYSTQSSASGAYNFYTSELVATQNLLAKITNERDVTVPQTKKIVTDTLTAINNSNSSEEIFSLLNAYQNQVDAQGLPTISLATQRDGDLQLYTLDINTTKLKTISGGEGPIPTYTTQCQTDDAAVREAIRQRDNPYNGGE